MMRTFFISGDGFAHDAGAETGPRIHTPIGRVQLRLFATKLSWIPTPVLTGSGSRVLHCNLSRPEKLLASTPSRRDSSHCLHEWKNTSDHRLAHKGGATFKSRDPTVYCP